MGDTDDDMAAMAQLYDEEEERDRIPRRRRVPSGWQCVGAIHVDAGLMYLGDPCYVLGDDASSKVESWDAFCEDPVLKKMDEGGLGAAIWQNGTGAICSTGYGDGTYEVFIKKYDNRVAEMKIVFIDEEEY